MRVKNSIFSFKEYKSYLIYILDERSKTKKGQRLKLSEHVKCRPSFITQVLKGLLDFSPEQALATSIFLGHTETEAKYFLNLVLVARSGTQELKRYYTKELQKLSEEHLMIKNRLVTNRVLNETEQAKYYRNWYFAAVHMIVSIPKYRKIELIADALQLPLKTVNEVVEFLVSVGLLKILGKEIIQGERNLIIGTDSPFLLKHQSNWRLHAIRSLDIQKPSDLHYSGVITCSHSDLAKIREILVETIQEIRATVKDSEDETMATYNLDLFSLL